MDYSAQFRREATGELTLKPSPEAVALAAAYRKIPTPGRSWPAARVKEEAIARVAAAGGDSSCHQLVLSESALQFGQYRGKTFKWLLSNDVGYAAMVLAVHQREREAGDTTQSFIMGNKDALLRYAGLFPVMMAAISERRVREGHGTPAQEDQVLVGFGNFAAMSFKDLYEATVTEDSDSNIQYSVCLSKCSVFQRCSLHFQICQVGKKAEFQTWHKDGTFPEIYKEKRC
ncbi:uncharacterized protein isoform X2 [Danio rerio]|nr:uncharacterized protein LOC108183327 isoform X1 [Danio rerio]|eukprot:XP_017210681.1 uncharacterized protein LOC108183327 isoform X1 [Danio rerio]